MTVVGPEPAVTVIVADPEAAEIASEMDVEIEAVGKKSLEIARNVRSDLEAVKDQTVLSGQISLIAMIVPIIPVVDVTADSCQAWSASRVLNLAS